MSERGTTDRQLTHHDDCWVDGPEHYMCAMWKISQLAMALGEAASLISYSAVMTAEEVDEESNKFEVMVADIQGTMLKANYGP
jgi:hypothetical protein